MNYNLKKIAIVLLIAIVIYFIGFQIVLCSDNVGYELETAILYLCAVIGAGCFWIGINKK